MRNKYLNKEAFKEKYGERYGEELIRYAKSDPTSYANIYDTQYFRNWIDNAVYRVEVNKLGGLSNMFCFFLRNYNPKRKTFTSRMYDYHYYTDEDEDDYWCIAMKERIR